MASSSAGSSKKKNYKGRSPNVMRFIESCDSEVNIGDLIAVSVKCRLQTADCRLQTGGKMQTRGKMQTKL